MVRVVAVAVLLVACTGDDEVPADAPRCTPPPAPEYACQPVTPGTASTCTGGPNWYGTAYDADKAFPRGCEVMLPFCVGAFPNAVQTCTCTESVTDATQSEWICPV